VLQPIRVRPCGAGSYEIVAGERRWRAARDAGLRDIPAVVVAADDTQAHVESLIENVQREDLNAVDRAHALQQLRVNLGLQSWEEVGQVIGVTRQHVHNLLRITALPPHMQDDVRAGDLTEKHCRALLRLRDDADAQQELWERIHADSLTGDGAIAESRRVFGGRDRDDASMRGVPARGGAAHGGYAGDGFAGDGSALNGSARDGAAEHRSARNGFACDGSPADGSAQDTFSGPAPAFAVAPRPRLSVVADALIEALADATDTDVLASVDSLVELHARLSARLAGVRLPAEPTAAGPAVDEWRPVLVPVAQHQQVS
jgi:ParB/RepB/Spo0J family partition protein